MVREEAQQDYLLRINKTRTLPLKDNGVILEKFQMILKIFNIAPAGCLSDD
jgi:hypothetical protein